MTMRTTRTIRITIATITKRMTTRTTTTRTMMTTRRTIATESLILLIVIIIITIWVQTSRAHRPKLTITIITITTTSLSCLNRRPPARLLLLIMLPYLTSPTRRPYRVTRTRHLRLLLHLLRPRRPIRLWRLAVWQLALKMKRNDDATSQRVALRVMRMVVMVRPVITTIIIVVAILANVIRQNVNFY